MYQFWKVMVPLNKVVNGKCAVCKITQSRKSVPGKRASGPKWIPGLLQGRHP